MMAKFFTNEEIQSVFDLMNLSTDEAIESNEKTVENNQFTFDTDTVVDKGTGFIISHESKSFVNI